MKVAAGEIKFVKIPDRDFLMGRYPVTNCQYELFDPSHERSMISPDDGSPVAAVNWHQAWSFAKYVGGVTVNGEKYRVELPLESEWEYACRAGSTTEFCYGDDEARLGKYAWHKENSNERSRPVGLKLPNAWGLYDMHGNVWEMCQDWYDDESCGKGHVMRGGSYETPGWECRSAARAWSMPGTIIIDQIGISQEWSIGFRLAAVPESSPVRH